MERERSRRHVRETSAGGSNAFLGKGSRVVGKLTFEGPVRIEGHVEGEIIAQDALTIGESAVINAQIVGNTVVIQGRVTGDVTARKRLKIRAPGKLNGTSRRRVWSSRKESCSRVSATWEQATRSGRTTAATKDRQGTQKVTPFPTEGATLKVHSEGTK